MNIYRGWILWYAEVRFSGYGFNSWAFTQRGLKRKMLRRLEEIESR